MKVSPLDVQQKRFHLGFRGYEREEVDAFLELVREEMEALVRENAELREFRQAYEENVRSLREQEETVKSTLLMTQRVIEDMKENARKEATLVMKDAEVRSQQLLGSAQQEKGRLEGEIVNLRRQQHQVLQNMKKMLETHLEMVRYEEDRDEGEAGKAAK